MKNINGFDQSAHHITHNFKVLAVAVQKTMVKETGSPNVDLDLCNSIAWAITECLPRSLYVPIADTVAAAKAEMPGAFPLQAEISPSRREILRQNIEDCFNPKKQPDSTEKLEAMYRIHVSELLGELERLEFLLQRITTEYLADKATLQDENSTLFDEITKLKMWRDVFAKPDDSIREDRIAVDS